MLQNTIVYINKKQLYTIYYNLLYSKNKSNFSCRVYFCTMPPSPAWDQNCLYNGYIKILKSTNPPLSTQWLPANTHIDQTLTITSVHPKVQPVESKIWWKENTEQQSDTQSSPHLQRLTSEEMLTIIERMRLLTRLSNSGQGKWRGVMRNKNRVEDATPAEADINANSS